MEVDVDVVNGRFKIIDDLREENKKLKEESFLIQPKEGWILDYADYIHYTVKTNSDIKLGISIRKEDQDIFRDEGREGTIYRLGIDPEYDKEIFKTWRTDDIKTCIEKANDYIKNTFKTDLD